MLSLCALSLYHLHSHSADWHCLLALFELVASTHLVFLQDIVADVGQRQRANVRQMSRQLEARGEGALLSLDDAPLLIRKGRQSA